MLQSRKKRVQSSSSNYQTDNKHLLSLNSNLSERKKIQSTPRMFVRHQRYKSESSEDISQSFKNKKFKYNKWYINPQVRMKMPIVPHHKTMCD